MKPRIFKLARRIALLLLLGAILNVAVAWGCAALHPYGYPLPFGHRQLPTGNHWIVMRSQTFGVARICSDVPAGSYTTSPGMDDVPPEELLSDWSRIRPPVLPADSAIKARFVSGRNIIGGPTQTLVDQACGWPLLSMWCGWGDPASYTYNLFSNPKQPIVSGIDCSPPNANKYSVRGLPLGVLWNGFAINTVFYAGLCAFGPGLIRSARGAWRLDRGRCPQCGYDLREKGQQPTRYMLRRGCPECGWHRQD